MVRGSQSKGRCESRWRTREEGRKVSPSAGVPGVLASGLKLVPTPLPGWDCHGATWAPHRWEKRWTLVCLEVVGFVSSFPVGPWPTRVLNIPWLSSSPLSTVLPSSPSCSVLPGQTVNGGLPLTSAQERPSLSRDLSLSPLCTPSLSLGLLPPALPLGASAPPPCLLSPLPCCFSGNLLRMGIQWKLVENGHTAGAWEILVAFLKVHRPFQQLLSLNVP